jgi:hypothetical protein
MKTLVAAAALAALITTPALAQTFDRLGSNPQSVQTAPRAGAPDAVMKGRQMIGRDPDPWVRNEILRHSDSGWPD